MQRLIIALAEPNQQEKELINEVLSNCQKVQQSLSGLDNSFVEFLYRYLSMRSYDHSFFSGGAPQIRERAVYINRLVLAIHAGDLEMQKNLLTEENIKPFKGFLSKRFYNMLRDRREELDEAEKVSLEDAGEELAKPKLS